MTKEEAGQIVIDAFEMWKSEYSYIEDWSKEDEALDMALKALDQEQKTGHWEKVSDGYGLTSKVYICKCSECDDTVWCYLGTEREWKFCPSCGAKMSENEEV